MHDAPPPVIHLKASGRFGGQIKPGSRVLARMTAQEDGDYEASAIRILPGVERIRMVGVVRKNRDEEMLKRGTKMKNKI